jgi:APA family basic amino acid/polyamine antiporter
MRVSNNGGGLIRRLTFSDAVVVGLASMIGAGVFSAFAPAAATAGSALLVGLAIAAFVALLNATASAQLASQYPTSGGTYIYGRERLGPWAGYLAGWSFVVGKTASCAAMALTFAAYVVPPAWAKPVAVGAVLLLAGVNYVGVTRTIRLARVIVVFVLVVLTLVVVAGASGGTAPTRPLTTSGDVGWYGVLQSAGLLFFAFAGYARLATLGEEVINPRKTIPRAILTALFITLTIYALIGVTLLNVLGPSTLAQATAPLTQAVEQVGWGWSVPWVTAGAAAASLGALLALIAGVSRTTLAMARNRDLPTWLAAVHPRFAVPHHAELFIAAIVCALVLLIDLRGAIGFSSFGVLLYYAIANAAAFTQKSEDRLYPRWLQPVGVIACVVLMATLPLPSVVGGLIVLAAGAALRFLRRQSQ